MHARHDIIELPPGLLAAVLVADLKSGQILTCGMMGGFSLEAGGADEQARLVAIDHCVTSLRTALKQLKDGGSASSDLRIMVLANAKGIEDTRKPFYRELKLTIGEFFARLGIPVRWRVAVFAADGLEGGKQQGIKVRLSPTTREFEFKRQPAAKKIRVMIVDDSRVIHKLLGDIFSSDPRFEVVGSVLDPVEAESRIEALAPDVMTLDFQMPRMDGLTYLRQMIPRRQLPVLMVSGASNEDGRLALQALELGALDFIPKPSPDRIDEFSHTIREKAAAAAQVKRSKIQAHTFQKRFRRNQGSFDASRIVLIGASTGGTVALSELIPALPKDFPPIAIVQHIPEKFSALFAERLNAISNMAVAEARDGDELLPGRVLIAPGGKQMRIDRKGTRFVVRVTDDDPVNRHKPSVDYMFDSACEILGPQVIAALLTGMGRDGAQGLLHLREKGATTIAQDAQSCVVYGMPKAAAEIGAPQMVLPLDEIADKLMALAGSDAKGSSPAKPRLKTAP